MKRDIIEIDDRKCTGCGLCITACAEGALELVNGKARLISDTYCDGLGACLKCPEGALRIVQREADAFDEEAALAAKHNRNAEKNSHAGCPGSMARTLGPIAHAMPAGVAGSKQASLASWPIQLDLVPASAPFLHDATILLAAHCAGFALPNLHQDWLAGRIVIIACPKLGNREQMLDRLIGIIAQGGIRQIDILRMSVPCCGGLEHLTRQALEAAGSAVPCHSHVVNIG